MKKRWIAALIGLALCVAAAFLIESFMPMTFSVDLKKARGIVMEGDTETESKVTYRLEGYDSFDEFAEEAEYPTVTFEAPGAFSAITLEMSSQDECEVTYDDGVTQESFYLEYGETQLQLPVASGEKNISLTFSDPSAVMKKIQLDLLSGSNPYRVIYMSLALGAVLMFVIFARQVAAKIEYGFLIAAIACVLLIALMAPQNSAMWWDGDIHYTNTERISLIPQTLFEAGGVSQVLQNLDVSTPSYLVQSTGMFLGRLLPLNDWAETLFHRLFIGAFYVTVCFFAIKMVSHYKRALTVIALLPLPLFTAVAYSYDSSINALAFFGSALILDELATPNRRLTFARAALITVSLSLVCMPKTLYMPILLLAAFMPASKFESRKAARWYRIGVVAACLALVTMYLAPFMLNQETFNDHRANSPSGSEQLKFILSDIPGYLSMVASDFTGFFGDMLLIASRTAWAYFGTGTDTLSLVSLIVMIFAIVTDEEGTPVYERITWRKKCAIAAMCCLSVLIIYTSLYISFTSVGDNHVGGMQGRYFLPLFLLAAAVINPTNIRSRMNTMKLNVGLCLFSAVVVFVMAWQLLVVPHYL